MLFQLEETKLAAVAIALPIDDPFTYIVPEELQGKIHPGVRVLIPFTNREIVGYVVHVKDAVPPEGTKKIIRILDDTPILSDHFLELTSWMSRYYFSSWGEAIQSAVPKPYRETKRPKYKKEKEDNLEPKKAPIFKLNSEQDVAVQQLNGFLRDGAYHGTLLFGVTGSGKSEVYIRTIKEAISIGKTAICLVPEIALTEQLKLFFESHFHNQLEIVHSKLSDGERWHAWERLRQGERKVVLGPRSAIFAPLQNLGLIIIDEEHEPSYKQDQTPRYHAREVAKWRAEKLGAVLVMGTATPSLETLKEAKEGKLTEIKLRERIDNKKLPEIEIIDLNQIPNPSKTIISPRLARAIEGALGRKEGILLLLNRRGFSTYAQCLSCKRQIHCRYCDVALTYHQADQRLVCHYCNFELKDSSTCPKCGQKLLQFFGMGTEKVESEVARLFPMAKIGRLDSDSARRKNSHLGILEKFRTRQFDILVGTQMIAKGFDFQHVSLVGVVLADTSLALPDFRSSEKTFQLLTQVAGRSGRGEAPGKVMIQTFLPLHYSIQLAQKHDSEGFFREEMGHRESFGYPPFTKLVNIIIRGKREDKTIESAQALRYFLDQNVAAEDGELIGPAPLPFHKLRGHYRWHIMIKIKGNVTSAFQAIKSALKQAKKVPQIHIAIDVDPLAIL